MEPERFDTARIVILVMNVIAIALSICAIIISSMK